MYVCTDVLLYRKLYILISAYISLGESEEVKHSGWNMVH